MKKWFVLYTKPQHELKVVDQLTSIGILCYCPTITLIKQYSDRKKKIQKPLISSYVMVYIDENERNSVFTVSGIIRYLFWLVKPAEVKGREINLMKKYLDGVYEDFNLNNLKKDQLYKISDGPLAGATGRVIESQKYKVKLEVKSLGMIVTLRKQAA